MENQTIINDYQKLIIFVIKDMNLLHKLDELIDIGMIGFVRGINTYDASMNIKYSTYLYTCIKNEITHQLVYEKREKRAKYKTVSLNKLINNNIELQDLLGYEVDYFKDYCTKESIRVLKYEIENLSYTDQLLLNHLYGINGYERMGVTQLSKYYGISRQAIYQKKKKLLRIVKKKLDELGYL